MTPIDRLRVDRTIVTEYSIEEASVADQYYWLSKSLEERLEAMELMRQINYGYDPATTRLQRVLKIVERKAS